MTNFIKLTAVSLQRRKEINVKRGPHGRISLTSEHRCFGVAPLLKHGEDVTPLVGAGVKSLHSVEPDVPVKASHCIQLPVQLGGADVTPASGQNVSCSISWRRELIQLERLSRLSQRLTTHLDNVAKQATVVGCRNLLCSEEFRREKKKSVYYYQHSSQNIAVVKPLFFTDGWML